MGKGQVSIEYMLVLGFMFLMLVPLLVLFSSTQRDTTDQLTEGQLRKVGNVLRDTAERLYYAGDPAQEIVQVYFPERVENVTINGTDIAFTVAGGAGRYDLVIAGLAPVNGTLGTWQGVHVVTLRAENGIVQIYE